MSAVLERARSNTPVRQLYRPLWSAWCNGDDRVRVQINEPSLAKTFAKVSGVTRTGYSVAGPFTRLYLTQHTRDWVENWMKEHNQGARPKCSAARSPERNT
jgi:hypothetical protein